MSSLADNWRSNILPWLVAFLSFNINLSGINVLTNYTDLTFINIHNVT